MVTYANAADRDAIQNEMPWNERDVPATLYQLLGRTAARFPDRNAFTFQFFSDPRADAETLTWRQMQAEVSRAANLFRSLGVGEDDSVAVLLPNCTETFVALFGAQVAGITAPINPLLETEQIAGILRETGAKVLVTLRPSRRPTSPRRRPRRCGSRRTSRRCWRSISCATCASRKAGSCR